MLEQEQRSMLEQEQRSKSELEHMQVGKPADKREHILARHSSSLCGYANVAAAHHHTTIHRHNVTIATWRSIRRHKNFHRNATIAAWQASHHRHMNSHHNFRQAGS